MTADEAASIAEVAADEAAMPAEAAMSDTAEAGAIVAGGIVVVVVVSSFFVQAAKVTAAASVAINRAVLMFLLDLGSYNFRQLWEPSLRRPPAFEGKERACVRCLADDYRRLRGFP
jgi:hypothetical protein